MRTIKFRGKSKKTNDWVYGYLYVTNNGEYEICQYSKDSNIENINESVIPDTVGQFTGLLDKNGNEIYEGDIVKWDEFTGNRYGVISWLCFSFCVVYYRRTGTEVKYELSEDDEVIGNIHDNPELL